MYFRPGAFHGSHHIFKEWADKYDGKFGEGWEVLRQMTFEKQREMGWSPKDAVLNPLAKGMQKWDDIFYDRAPFKFNGKIHKISIKYTGPRARYPVI